MSQKVSWTLVSFSAIKEFCPYLPWGSDEACKNYFLKVSLGGKWDSPEASGLSYEIDREHDQMIVRERKTVERVLLIIPYGHIALRHPGLDPRSDEAARLVVEAESGYIRRSYEGSPKLKPVVGPIKYRHGETQLSLYTEDAV